MTPEESAVVDSLRSEYDAIHDHLDELLNACNGNAALKRQLGNAMQEALDNFIEAQNRILGQSPTEIKKVNDAASTTSAQITSALRNLQDIKTVLNVLTTAVKQVSLVVALLPSV